MLFYFQNVEGGLLSENIPVSHVFSQGLNVEVALQAYDVFKNIFEGLVGEAKTLFQPRQIVPLCEVDKKIEDAHHIIPT